MGQVWLARRSDGLYEARAAIKLLRDDLAAAAGGGPFGTSGLAGRFARERAVLARLNHPLIGRLLDAGVAGNQAYLVLEYVDGSTLAEHARTHCHTVAQRVRLLVQIAEAVDYAHAQLIVHRDLKPSNVLVDRDGRPKLLDFGIAGLIDDGQPVDTDLTRQTGRGLTLAYAAPEQILGSPIGVAADVFSLGVMLFELLSGELPFAPRHTPRLAIERAVLHDEPRRLGSLAGRRPGSLWRRWVSRPGIDDTPTTTAHSSVSPPAAGAEADAAAPGDLAPHEDPASPGRPADIERVRGDLEAVVAKALRKDPAQRYVSVRALLDDLNAWLGHRPVSVRRDDWRRRSGLWLRRNALVAGSAVGVMASLAAGLAAATWQWQRAETSAWQANQVTSYLTDLLASADPALHGGQWPSVLQLLEESRKTLPQAFADDPDTRLRLLEVMADTHRRLNRFDASIPMYDEVVALAEKRYGPDHPNTLLLRIDRGRSLQVQGLFDKAIAALEPLRGPARRVLGEQSESRLDMMYALNGCYARTARLDESEQLLAELGPLVERMYPAGHPRRLSHLNHVQVLRAGQGRLREALAAMRQTEPYWPSIPRDHQQLRLVLQRNTIAIQIRLGDYDRIVPRIEALLAEGDRFLGAGNDFTAGLRVELARYHTEAGDARQALAVREDILARARAARIEHPAVLLPAKVSVLLARAQAHAADGPALVREARALLDEMQAKVKDIGYARASAWIDLARVGLLLDDAALAGEALGRLHADAGLKLDTDSLLASRVAQMDGELARLRGDLAASREHLAARVKVFLRPGDKQVLPAWVAALDLAYTLVLARDPQAAEALDTAAARRPPGAPAGHPLDLVERYLRAHLIDGPQAAGTRQALDDLARRQGRRAGQPPGPGQGSLAGAFI